MDRKGRFRTQPITFMEIQVTVFLNRECQNDFENSKQSKKGEQKL